MKNTYRCGGYYVYFTSQCLIEAFHVHSSVNKKREGSAKFWIKEDGSTVIAKKGRLSEKTLRNIQEFIGINYLALYNDWLESGGTPGFYQGN